MSPGTHSSDSSGDSSEDLHVVPRSPRKSKPPPLKFQEKHRLLALRLGPLRRIQTDLERRIGAATTEPISTSVTTAAPFDPDRPALKEFCINSTNGWKSALDVFRAGRMRPETGAAGTLRKLKSKDDETTEVIAECRDDMLALWEDPVVREMLARRKTRIEDSAGL